MGGEGGVRLGERIYDLANVDDVAEYTTAWIAQNTNLLQNQSKNLNYGMETGSGWKLGTSASEKLYSATDLHKIACKTLDIDETMLKNEIIRLKNLNGARNSSITHNGNTFDIFKNREGNITVEKVGTDLRVRMPSRKRDDKIQMNIEYKVSNKTWEQIDALTGNAIKPKFDLHLTQQ